MRKVPVLLPYMETLLLNDATFEERQQSLIEDVPRKNPPLEVSPTDFVELKSPSDDSGIMYRLKKMINKPWSADPEDLPEIRTPVMSGNSPEPFRTLPQSNKDRELRNSIIRYIKKNREISKLSDWSYIFSNRVPIQNLPAELEGFRLGHLADVHVSSKDGRTLRELENFADLLLRGEIKLDALVLAGDIIKHHPDDLSPRALNAFERIAEMVPEAYFVLGNHDYYASQSDTIIHRMKCYGWNYVGNDCSIQVAGKRFNIYGMDDAIHGSPVAQKVITPDEFNLLLLHNLDAARSNCDDLFDFVLSGHTHWGESRLISGEILMKWWDHGDNVNLQTRGWKMLTNRALSYVHPGLERHYVKSSYLRIPAGFAVHTLVDAANAIPSHSGLYRKPEHYYTNDYKLVS